jgi:prepilin-type N-terminal cleavage/methylation domain-containing protein
VKAKTSLSQTRAGFTLVELIVVIVILGILAAIAIPALTGYISKAEDKQYEMRARDINIAVHAVIDEAWAQGNFATTQYFNEGVTAYQAFKYFDTGTLSANAYDWYHVAELYERAAALLGEQYVGWPYYLYLCTAQGSDATAATADGFLWELYYEGSTPGKPNITVTYKLTRYDGPSFQDNFWDALGQGTITYDANAGYEVYHFAYGGQWD